MLSTNVGVPNSLKIGISDMKSSKKTFDDKFRDGTCLRDDWDY